MNLITIVKPMLERAIICDHCLGRQFALLGTGLENSERGMHLRNACILDAHRVLKKSSEMQDDETIMNQNIMKTQAMAGSSIASRLLERLSIPMERASKKPATPNAKRIIETVDCIICRGIFSSKVLLDLIDDAIDITNEMEFSTMLVGTRISPIFLEREEEFRVLHGLKWGESFKSHFNRFIGRELTFRIGKDVDFSRPDIVFIFNISDKDSINISVQVNPYFIYGRYKKNIRGIPQTHWPHKACNGKGCEECDNTGKQYQQSVEELIAKPVIEETRAGSIKFHGAGRE
ncbi:hypothetical protein GF325_12610, partial [Candidatus Bathyarchaeota archaeon]|nr:hypothetical protein [Candidatus Bathyarchaeota archaeon]